MSSSPSSPPLDLPAIRARCAAAIPRDGTDPLDVEAMRADLLLDGMYEEWADFIAHARTDLPALLAAYTALVDAARKVAQWDDGYHRAITEEESTQRCGEYQTQTPGTCTSCYDTPYPCPLAELRALLGDATTEGR